MSFHNLRRLEYAPDNNTAIPGIAHLPTSILDAFIPGYSFISKYLLDVFGFDISIIVSVLVLGFALTTGVHYIYRHLWASFLKYFTASVVIDAYDIIHDNLMYWAEEQEDLKRVRALRVQSADYTDDVDELKGDDNASEGAIFNFNSWAAKVPPRYEPDSGYHWFRHKGHWFKLSREKQQVQSGWMGMMVREQETVRLTVLGRSTQPIKDLLLDTRDKNLSKQIAKTVVRRPSPKENRGRGRQAWSKVAVRPSRPISTVVLDNKQKAAILRDINDFLNPATSRWYANRGLPYRRGYLLFGPPGTGKTSLSFALAGVFGLDIYCMSLSEKTLTEEDLIMLFNSLPKRCIVLLEDIDSAGVIKKKTQEVAEDKTKDKKDSTSEKKDEDGPITASMLAKEVEKAVKAAQQTGDRSSGGRPGTANDSGITMSGLLNAIDGVASQEGRVLIMTSNYPENLDDALIRPGRVDMKIEFKLASKQQIRELFLRMYCVDSRGASRMPTNLKQIMPDILDVGNTSDRPGVSGKSGQAKPNHLQLLGKGVPPSPPPTPTNPTTDSQPPSSGQSSSNCKPLTEPPPDLEKMANDFADSLPDSTFSPAEVQGYLIMRKKDPLRAISEIAAWRDAELVKKKQKEEKESKDKNKDQDGAVGDDEQNKEDKGEEKQIATATTTESGTSSTSDLVKVVKDEAEEANEDGDSRAGQGKVHVADGEVNVYNNDGTETTDNHAHADTEPAVPPLSSTGARALFGNVEGVQDDGPAGGDDSGGDSADEDGSGGVSADESDSDSEMSQSDQSDGACDGDD